MEQTSACNHCGNDRIDYRYIEYETDNHEIFLLCDDCDFALRTGHLRWEDLPAVAEDGYTF